MSEKYQLVGDSSMELTDELIQLLPATTVPLTMRLGEKEFVDDDMLDMTQYLEALSKLKGAAHSACPSPDAFLSQCKQGITTFFITLSGKLSGSFQSASVAANMAQEQGLDAYAFDSRSASAGETLLGLKIGQMVQKGLPKDEIVAAGEAFIAQMRTFFVLEDLTVFANNGRIPKLLGKVVNAMNIRLILGSDKEGHITLYNKGRGETQSLISMVKTVGDHLEAPEHKTLVISHCNCMERADKLRAMLAEKYSFERIIINSTRGLSSMYANQGGLIVAY